MQNNVAMAASTALPPLRRTSLNVINDSNYCLIKINIIKTNLPISEHISLSAATAAVEYSPRTLGEGLGHSEILLVDLSNLI